MTALQDIPPIRWMLVIRSKSPALRYLTRWLYRMLNFRLAAYFKLRELLVLSDRNFVATLDDSAQADCRGKLSNWLSRRVSERNRQTEDVTADLIIQVKDTGALSFELLPELLSNNRVRNFTFGWSNARPPYDPRSDLSDTEIRQWDHARESLGTDLHQPPPAYEWTAPMPSHGAVAAIQSDASRRINELLKTTAPGAICIALALEEDELGFCDTALVQWLSMLQEIYTNHPGIIFCLLNRTTLDWEKPRTLERAGILAVRSRGLDAISAISLATQADIFVGRAGPYSLAALHTTRAGITLLPQDSEGVGYRDESRHWFLAKPDFQIISDKLSTIIREFQNTSQRRTIA